MQAPALGPGDIGQDFIAKNYNVPLETAKLFLEYWSENFNFAKCKLTWK